MLLGHDLDILVWARLLQRRGQWQPRRDLEPTVTCRFRRLRLLGYETGLSLGTFRDLRVLGDDTWCSTEIMPETTEHANPIFRWRRFGVQGAANVGPARDFRPMKWSLLNKA